MEVPAPLPHVFAGTSPRPPTGIGNKIRSLGEENAGFP